MTDDIKIYQMNDCDWYAAKSTHEAIEFMRVNMGARDINELIDDYDLDVKMLEEGELLSNWFTEECGEIKMTFRKKLEQMLANGEKFPCIFASTEY